MKRLLCLVALFCAAAPVWAGDAPLSKLSSTEFADGWILLFDGESTFGWGVNGGEAKVKDGTLVVSGGKDAVVLTNTAFGPGEILVEWRWNGKTLPAMVVSDKPWKGTTGKKGIPANTWIRLFGTVGGGTNMVSFEGAGPSAFKGGTQAVTSDARGHFGFGVPTGSTLEIRLAKFKPLGLKSIFNGKNLKGWKEFPDRKSKFSVTKEGWLNVKNGNGDLQSVGKWADFTLQIDCISNGDFLNSGIFFRCQPDKYQQGYELQIHNKYTKDGKTYVLADYDPKTHELIGKRKVTYPADDYGTGAIYRRIPARKQASKDREWFTMTVIAEGRHIAVWVNGVPVTDWDDNRPDNDNARDGYRAAAGPISIQGHDPTTDLSFRNVRIAELPKAAK